MRAFSYRAAKSLDEAAAAFAKAEAPAYLAGGMTLIPTLKQRLASPSEVIDLARIPGLDEIAIKGERLHIGALATHAEVAASAVVRNAIPALASLAGRIGDPQVRNLGTLGGSLANSDPAADYPAAVLALDAIVRTGRREIPADAYFKDLFETALEAGEIITGVAFAIPKRAIYAKFPNPVSGYALAGVFVAESPSGVRVAVTGAGPCAFRQREMEAALTKNFSTESLRAVKVSAEGLNADLHAAADYRAHLIGVLAARAVARMTGCET
jgi:aerobic carbon-monoxide dehydrogenase medium subunit